MSATQANGLRRYIVGVCAMEKKTRSKPMQEILKRLDQKKQFDIYIFDDKTILEIPVEEWPICDALISFYSSGFPLTKAIEYAKLVRPILVNDLQMQELLLDRRKIYEVLEKYGIPVARHVIANHGLPGEEFEEYDNYIVANGVRVDKPFVEKPTDAENHNINIYYPASAGGGVQKLFRKIGDRSNEFHREESRVRRDGSYIYEEFLNTQGTDVKVYTVGVSYGHAEARKSPTLDGRVIRDSVGKEVRYPVMLNTNEKEICAKICTAFRQTVCGFDMLRVRGKSYVCDVNGWSFVKNTKKYYDDCGIILHNSLVSALRIRYFRQLRASSYSTRLDGAEQLICPQYAVDSNYSSSTPTTPTASPDMSKASVGMGSRSVSTSNLPTLVTSVSDNCPCPFLMSSAREATIAKKHNDILHQNDTAYPDNYNIEERAEELRCVIGVVRHGDRMPKQKLKTIVWEKDLVDFYESRISATNTTLCSTGNIVGKPSNGNIRPSELKVKAIADLQELLTRIRRMIKWYAPTQGSKKAMWEVEGGDSYEKLLQAKRVLERWEFKGINRKVQFKPQKNATNDRFELLMIVKWGGDLTGTGQLQGELLGKIFRSTLYPGDEFEPLRLHSTFRHDLRIFTSDEGRVQMTAAAFAKGFLDLDGDLTPILVSLVTTLGQEANKMLDHSGQAEAYKEMRVVKDKLREALQREYDSIEDLIAAVAPMRTASVVAALQKIQNPRSALAKVNELIRKLKCELQDKIKEYSQNAYSTDSNNKDVGDCTLALYMGESLSMMVARWDKIYYSFYSTKSGVYDVSKIPDIYDCAKYDIVHNSHVGLLSLSELFQVAGFLASCYVPQEYGLDLCEKQSIGIRVSQPLCATIRGDIVAVMSSPIPALAAKAQTTLGSILAFTTPFPLSSPLSSPSSTRSTPTALPVLPWSTSATSPRQDLGIKEDEALEHEDTLDCLSYQLDPTFAKEHHIKGTSTQVRTRMYFTSESTMHTLLNVLRYQCPSWQSKHKKEQNSRECEVSLEEELFSDEIVKGMGLSGSERGVNYRKYIYSEEKMISREGTLAVENIPELNYLAHIIIRVFERRTQDTNFDDNFRVEISFSPGVKNPTSICEDEMSKINPESLDKNSIEIHDSVFLTRNMSGQMFEEMLAACVSSTNIKQDTK